MNAGRGQIGETIVVSAEVGQGQLLEAILEDVFLGFVQVLRAPRKDQRLWAEESDTIPSIEPWQHKMEQVTTPTELAQLHAHEFQDTFGQS